MATLVSRLDKGFPLTNAELDQNFINLNDELALKLDASSYTANDVLSKLLTVDTNYSGLNAQTLVGLGVASSATINTVVIGLF